MPLFALTYGYPYETCYFAGVFSTRERAEQYFKSLQTGAEMYIDECEVDEKVPTPSGSDDK
jgi:ATP phosphoribosyltransferase regulatory subunit HisZ